MITLSLFLLRAYLYCILTVLRIHVFLEFQSSNFAFHYSIFLLFKNTNDDKTFISCGDTGSKLGCVKYSDFLQCNGCLLT